MSEEKKTAQEIVDASMAKVPWYGYVALILAIIFFAGIFNATTGFLQADGLLDAERWGWTRVLDFDSVLGAFGRIAGGGNFIGVGGTGARHGFLFALTLIPAVLFALGMVQVIDHAGGLKAGQKLLTPLLKPLMGIPGICGLGIVSSLQSTDAGAGMIKTLREADFINEREKTIFAAFQFSAGGTLTNYLSSGAAVFAFITVPVLIPLIVIFIFKVFGANVVRFWLANFDKKGKAEMASQG
jgi:nucleoside recognition membrane protein YjiH